MINIDLKIQKFKDKLVKTEDINEIINKYILFGTPFIFEENEEKYYNLKKVIADYFKTSYRNVFMVGSSKLGFSIAPKKLFYHIDWDDGKDSDVDIAVISYEVFCEYWNSILDYEEKTIPLGYDDIRKKFLDYFFRGWIRPDKLDNRYTKKDEWFEFCRSISYKKEFGDRGIKIALYKDDSCFMRYHSNNLKNLKYIIKSEEEK